MKKFPPFRLDAADHSLWRDDQRVPLTPKAFAVLCYLVDRAGRLVTQNELLEALWPDTFVQPEVLKSQILDIRSALGDRPRDPLFIETVARRGYRFIAPVQSVTESAGDSPKLIPREKAQTQSPTANLRIADIQSIAVLPFLSMSGDPENEHFADGLTEELINALTYVQGLRVVARTSVFCFKSSIKDIREIGTDLNVETVLEGSVRRSGNQLRVTAQLIDVSTGYHLLSRTFPRELKDVFALQEELASAVVTEIMPAGRAPSSVAINRTTNLEAYDLYLKAMAMAGNRFSGPVQAAEMFREVLEKEPEFAPAWAGLACSLGLMAWFAFMPARSAMPKAKHAAQRALQLDPRQGLAHACLGVVQGAFEWNWEESERSFERAIEVQPGLAITHQFHAICCLLPQMRFQEATAATERAIALNPLDGVLSGTAIYVYASVGDLDAAEKRYAISKEVFPNHPLIHVPHGLALEQRGRLPEALASYQRAADLSGQTAIGLGSVGRALALSGDLAGARRMLVELEKQPANGFSFAMLYSGLGEDEEALRWFEKAVDEREPHVITAPFDPRFRTLRAQPRFAQIMAKIGLSQRPPRF
jgi:TolB-like protein/tetratricopeptide (TPR) repeat protein